jgi:hypothetical protein
MTAILLTPSLWANWNDTATGIDLNKLPHPVLTRVYTGPLQPGHRATIDGIAVVYHGENGYGIKTLVSSNGRTQLLISNYDEAKSDARAGPFCSGHWTTQLYEFRNFVVEELRGKYNGIDFPFVHNWSYVGTECQPEAGGPTEPPQ